MSLGLIVCDVAPVVVSGHYRITLRLAQMAHSLEFDFLLPLGAQMHICYNRHVF